MKGRGGLIYFNKVHYNKDHHVQSLLSKASDSFSGKFVFNETEMEVSAINCKIFSKLYLKIRVRGKEISYVISSNK